MSDRITTTVRRALFAATVALVPVGVVLTVVGITRDQDLPHGRKSRVMLAGLGGGAALLYAVVGGLIARAEPRNASWISLVAAVLLASFGARVRQRADLERVVTETMQPAHVSLWRRGARS